MPPGRPAVILLDDAVRKENVGNFPAGKLRVTLVTTIIERRDRIADRAAGDRRAVIERRRCGVRWRRR